MLKENHVQQVQTWPARAVQDRFEAIDLMQLPNFRMYLKLMIDGMPSKPFSAVTLPPSAWDLLI
jgi:hypothetical protein